MKSKTIYLSSYGPANLFNLNKQILNYVKDTELIDGLVLAFSVGSTGALLQMPENNEKGFSSFVMSFIPYRPQHRHVGNAFSHLRSTFLGSDSTVTVQDGKIKFTNDLFLLENTAGRKQRPLELRAFGRFAGGGRLNMKVASNTLPVEANGWIDIIELSEIASDVVLNSGISDGFLHIESLAAKSAISTTEFEAPLLQDTADFMAQVVEEVKDESKGYIVSALIGPSMNFPIKDGRLELGTWQQPIFLDFGEPGPKDIFFQAVGL